MERDSHIEVYCYQQNYNGERICGDVFLSKRIAEEQRLIAILSDGMGHGVKANILATLTSGLLMGLTSEHRKISRVIEIITKTLPVCSKRKISYSTFSIADLSYNGAVKFLEYDNPPCMLISNGTVSEPSKQKMVVHGMQNRRMELKASEFNLQKEDRLLICTDGVIQSGTGGRYPEGWGWNNMKDFVEETVQKDPKISAAALASKVVNRAVANDIYNVKDDCSCAVVYYRQPRRLMICSGPPFDESADNAFARQLQEFDGQKVICGATTADIIAREWQQNITDSAEFHDHELPPISAMKGVDLITEGMLTLNKTTRLLQKHDSATEFGKGPADRLAALILSSDQIYFLVGTRINEAHQDPTLPVELDIRRNVIKRLARLLETRFLKEISVEYR